MMAAIDRRMRVGLVLTVLGAWVVVGAALAGQAQAPPLPLTPAALEKATDKLAAIPEMTVLRIQNAVLKANVALGQLQATPAWKVYQQHAAEAEKVIKAEVAAFEKDRPGETIDTAKMIAIKKPAEKGK